MKKEYICENCGKKFRAEESQRKGKHIFCSMKCQHEWRTGKTGLVKQKGVTKKCPVCGKEFYCYPCEVDVRITCSRACKAEYGRMKGVHSGENCNFWRGGYDSYRGKNWYSQRKKALERDNNTCAVCGKTAQEQGYDMIVHHIVPFRFFENDYQKANSLDNLICVCHNCHAKQESHHWHTVPEEYWHLLKGVVPQAKPPAGERYTEEELQFIRENFDKMEYKKLAEIMGRTLNSVADKISNMGLKKGRHTVFTQEEIDFIVENYPTQGPSFFCKNMPDKSYNTIRSYCNRHGIHKKKRNTERSTQETE